jgi:hypothetical protein
MDGCNSKGIGKLMDALRLGIYALFTAASDLYADLGGRLFFGAAPDGAELPYGIFFFVSDVDDDTFTDTMKEVYVQFSLFSGDSSPAAILKADLDLTAMFKDKTFSVTGWTVVTMRRVSGSGPIYNSADVEAGTGFYWQTDVDYTITGMKEKAIETEVKSYAADIESWGSPEALAKGIRARMDGYPETIPNLIGSWGACQRIADFVKDYPELF